MHSLNLKKISEANVEFLLPEAEQQENEKKHVPRRSDPVFYNAKQALNRDISVLMVNAIKKLRLSKMESLAETFAGTGIRALRYAAQGPDIKNIYINDIAARSINLTKENFDLHKDKITPTLHYYNTDAKLFFLELRRQEIFLDFIDIDPYGTPQPYLHNAFLTFEKNAVIAVTATDMPVITGKFPEKAYRLYQIPNYKIVNRSYCHELGLRMLIAYIQREALFYKLPVIPLLSYYCDHYVRVFMHHDTSFTVDKIIQSHGYVTECLRCGKREWYTWKESFKHASICSNCSNSVVPIGPIYVGPLHDSGIVNELKNISIEFSKKNFIDRHQRLQRLLPLFTEDLKINSPWYYQLGEVSKRKKINQTGPAHVIEVLEENGIPASLTHFDGPAVKTNYPLELDPENLFS